MFKFSLRNSPKIKFILSLDGGGVRALATIIFLKRLEESLDQPLYDKFDFFIGTSAGAISCLGIAINQMNTSELIDFWSNKNLNKILSDSVWEKRANTFKSTFGLRGQGSKYYDTGKIDLLRDHFQEKVLGDSNKPVCAVCYDLEIRKPVILSSYNNADLLVVDVANATSAAPTYYPTAKVGNRYLIDGAIVANHPSLHGYVEAKKLFPEHRLKVLSVGTGLDRKPISGKESQSWGTIGWLRHNLFGLMAESSLDHELAEGIIGENYLRVNSDLGEVSPELDDNSDTNLNKIIEMGESWWESQGEEALSLLSND